jgi:hypothetical protein
MRGDGVKRVARIVLRCPECTQDFARRPKELARHPGSRHFCSMGCRGLAMRRRIVIVCAQCHVEFERAVAEVQRRRSGAAWCSRACQRIYWRVHGKSYPKIKTRHAHRMVAEHTLGRKLRSDEVVHHDNENRRDFAASNLTVMPRREHSRLHSQKVAAFRERDDKGRFI